MIRQTENDQPNAGVAGAAARRALSHHSGQWLVVFANILANSNEALKWRLAKRDMRGKSLYIARAAEERISLLASYGCDLWSQVIPRR